MVDSPREQEQQQKILVVDDDSRLRALLQRYLEEQGYLVKAVADAEQMDRALSREIYSLMVLDLMLPGEDGMSICKRMRESDDYLPKPFNPRELLARVKAVLRRQVKELPGAPSQQETVVSFGPFTLDLSTRTLTKEGNVVSLTTGEFAVMKALVQHPREPLTRDKLMNLARGREWSAMERSIDVQVSRLRRLIEDDPSNSRYIQTVWGVGYVFVPDGSAG